jgi:hypothetical protein
MQSIVLATGIQWIRIIPFCLVNGHCIISIFVGVPTKVRVNHYSNGFKDWLVGNTANLSNTVRRPAVETFFDSVEWFALCK